MKIADRRREAKARGDYQEAKQLNREFQKQARKDRERSLQHKCKAMKRATEKEKPGTYLKK